MSIYNNSNTKVTAKEIQQMKSIHVHIFFQVPELAFLIQSFLLIFF